MDSLNRFPILNQKKAIKNKNKQHSGPGTCHNSWISCSLFGFLQLFLSMMHFNGMISDLAGNMLDCGTEEHQINKADVALSIANAIL